MALTLDGALPAMGGLGGGTGAGLGAVGGGVAGLVLGGLLGAGLAGNRGWGGNGWGGGYGGPVANAATGAVADTIVLNPAFQSLQTQISSVGDQVSRNGLTNAISDVERSVSNNGSQIEGAIANLSTAQASQNFTTLQSINGLGRDITAIQNQAALQQLNSFNNLTTTTLQGFNNLQFQNAQGVNQIIAQGTASAAAMAAGFCELTREMATCCCEMKSAIAADGDATRALINDLNVQNLRDQLAAANGKVSNNEQNQYLLSTILTHLHPAPVVA